jgi:hypothetical protein
VVRATSASSAMNNIDNHVVLLGDSVFDNAAYVGDGPDVVTQLRGRLPAGWRASLLAKDGSVMRGILDQLACLPADASHLVVSIGGNDALGYSSVLKTTSHSVVHTLTRLTDIREQFQGDYVEMIGAVLGRGLPTAICTIYEPRYTDLQMRRVASTALMVINDCIIRAAVARGIPLIDLRVVCDEEENFANPIEPSVQGGWKIAGAIIALLSQHDFGRARTEVFTG